MYSVQVMLLIALWCGTPDTSGQINIVNQCRVRLNSCIDSKRVLAFDSGMMLTAAEKECLMKEKLQ